jgi:hypothetical protein
VIIKVSALYLQRPLLTNIISMISINPKAGAFSEYFDLYDPVTLGYQ